MSSTGYPVPQDSLPLRQESLGILARALQLLFKGKANNVTTLTLTANSATTPFRHPLLGPETHCDFQPLTAHAAAELGAGTMYTLAADKGAGTHTVTHANNAQLDRTFSVEMTG